MGTAFNPTAGRIWWKLLLALVVVAGGVLVGVHYLRPVALVVAVTRGNQPDAVIGSLTVKAERAPILTSEVSGRVVESHLALAQTIEKGDVLVKLDPRSVELEIDRLNAELETVDAQIDAGPADRFQLENLEDDLAYNERLLERSAVAPVEVDRLKRRIDALNQKINLDTVALEDRRSQLKNSIASRELQLEKMILRSPVDGTVNDIFVFPDDLVTPNAPIAQLVSLKRVVEVQVGEESIGKIAKGQRAPRVRLLSFGDAAVFEGTVAKILPAANAQTQRYTVFLDVDVDPARLTPGITGEALIYIAEHENTLLVPRKALVGDKVFVVRDGVVDIRKVEVGFVNLNQAEILSGVEEGESVIMDQLDLFKDGQRVRVEVFSGN